MGFSEVNKKLKNTKQTDFEDIVSQKLKGFMIYILDKPYNQGLYEQWIDVINRTNIPYELLVQNRQDVEFTYPNYLGNPKTLNELKRKITPKIYYLLIHHSFIPFKQKLQVE